MSSEAETIAQSAGRPVTPRDAEIALKIFRLLPPGAIDRTEFAAGAALILANYSAERVADAKLADFKRRKSSR